MALAFLRDLETRNAFGKVSRYHTAIGRSIRNNLREYQELKRSRRSEASHMPEAATDSDPDRIGRADT